jgi:hypothetical protein
MTSTAVRRLATGGLLGLTLASWGCARDLGDDLVIASPWSAADRGELEAAYRRWAGRNPGAIPGPVRINWVVLDPGDDPARVVRRRPPIDLLLGAPAATFERLARTGMLAPSDGDGGPSWRVTRRAPLVLMDNPASPVSGPIFDDPRHDPVSLAWARAELGAGGWARGYARLVDHASHARRVGRQPGSAPAAVQAGEARTSPAIAPAGQSPLVVLPIDRGADWVEGVALIAGCRHRDRAREFLRFLAEQGRAEDPPDIPADGAEAVALLADLLGATLVDTQDELWAARRSLDRADDTRRAEAWLKEAPPWPPASIEAIRGDPRTEPLVETLAAQIAPDADVRDWLLRSWRRPSRPIDGVTLRELAGAVGGRLAREPRLRDWLRAEWTAWARQRYRRVAEGSGEVPP